MDSLAFAVTLFLVLDPFGNAPLFHSVLSRVPEERRKWVMLRELLIALALLWVFLLFGGFLLKFLGVRPHTLSISGGIVLFLIALGMVFPARSVLVEEEGGEPFIVPLAMPFFVGPSALALLLLTVNKHPDQAERIAGMVTLAWFAAAAVLWLSPAILRVIGTKGSRALERLMGLLLILVAVQMFLDGVSNYLGG